MRITSFLLLFGLLSNFACNAQVAPLREMHIGNKVILILDSADASKTIVMDRFDRYFYLVNVSEMSIQMKKEFPAGTTREQVLPDYIQFLKTDVSSFDVQEAKFMSEVMEKIYKTVQGVNPAILPDTLKLIKTKGRHYGDGVYYTRDNCIIIPANELESKKKNAVTTTMFHELFHVYSRLNPDRRKQLYQLIGFTTVGFNQLDIPAGLNERVLFNPDGVDFAQRISLLTEDSMRVEAIPIIYANRVGHAAGQNEFFSYLEFNLYEIKQLPGGKWQVQVKDDGFTSTLSIDNLPDFFRQIKDNTGYIIHPDEVLADNFAFLMGSKNTPALISKFSAPGKKLISDIEGILK